MSNDWTYAWKSRKCELNRFADFKTLLQRQKYARLSISFMMFELPEMTKTSLLSCDSFVTNSRRGAYRWHSQVVDTLGSIYKVQNTLPFIQHGGRIPARSVRRISGYPRHRSVGTSCKRIGYYDVSKGTSLFMIYLRSTPTNQDPDKDQWESWVPDWFTICQHNGHRYYWLKS